MFLVLGTFFIIQPSFARVVEFYSNTNEVIPGSITYYTVSVPSDAITPKLVGTYQVMGGETIKVDVLEEEGCAHPMSPFNCVSVYSVSNRGSGNVDLNLEPGKTYYLKFSNEAFLFPTKTVNVDFQLVSDD